MIQRVQKKVSQQQVPSSRDWETPEAAPTTSSKLLSGRAAAIIGVSFAIAVCAGTLTYLTAGKRGASLAEAILVGAAAFAGAIRLLDSIIG
jgi:hypothetical protein